MHKSLPLNKVVSSIFLKGTKEAQSSLCHGVFPGNKDRGPLKIEVRQSDVGTFTFGPFPHYILVCGSLPAHEVLPQGGTPILQGGEASQFG